MEMTKEEFKKILLPLTFLDEEDRVWMTKALEGNFDTYKAKLKNLGDIGDVIDCDGCYKTGRSYLGSTCPKCNRPFRSVKP